jgi:hypothetical protein
MIQRRGDGRLLGDDRRKRMGEHDAAPGRRSALADPGNARPASANGASPIVQGGAVQAL